MHESAMRVGALFCPFDAEVMNGRLSKCVCLASDEGNPLKAKAHPSFRVCRMGASGDLTVLRRLKLSRISYTKNLTLPTDRVDCPGVHLCRTYRAETRVILSTKDVGEADLVREMEGPVAF